MLKRIFACFTILSYLVVGTMVVRFAMPEYVSVSFSSSYLNILTDAPMKSLGASELEAPELVFSKIEIPVEKIMAKPAPKLALKPTPKIEIKTTNNELPFHEPVVLKKVEMSQELPVTLLASYKEFNFEEKLIANSEILADEVTTSLAANEVTKEPEIFDYPAQAKNNEKELEKANVETPAVVEAENVADLLETKSTDVVEAEVSEPEFFDYPETKTTTPSPVAVAKAPPAAIPSALTFDYSQAKIDISQKVVPEVVQVTSHKPTHPITNAPKNSLLLNEEDTEGSSKNAFMASTAYPVSLSIRALGSNLVKMEDVQGFEVRFQDDLSEMIEDYGSGEVVFETKMNQPKMTRAVTLLKRGYVPTSTEIILEEGSGSVSIPLIEEETLNDLILPFERKGAVGAVLVELDDETDIAKLDVPFGDVVKLNGDFKKTENEDFRYQLFVGVQAGNAMVSYHRGNSEVVSKILHVHENELTYDANFYEDVINEKIRLYEEDLLAKENSPLIISGDQVKIFATNSKAKKINNHTYKMSFGSSHLGGRRYLELNHQSEPVFVGLRDNSHVTVPSENFMRFILSNVEGSKLGNRCLVQINLTKKAEKIDVASESVGQSLMTSTQMLDTDGKFYDSLSNKTQKVIIIGEGQGGSEVSPDAKVNIKIQYQDGSVQFLNSYCSPNTYLVEQL
jgi:hypothetical protein